MQVSRWDFQSFFSPPCVLNASKLRTPVIFSFSKLNTLICFFQFEIVWKVQGNRWAVNEYDYVIFSFCDPKLPLWKKLQLNLLQFSLFWSFFTRRTFRAPSQRTCALKSLLCEIPSTNQQTAVCPTPLKTFCFNAFKRNYLSVCSCSSKSLISCKNFCEGKLHRKWHHHPGVSTSQIFEFCFHLKQLWMLYYFHVILLFASRLAALSKWGQNYSDSWLGLKQFIRSITVNQVLK